MLLNASICMTGLRFARPLQRGAAPRPGGEAAHDVRGQSAPHLPRLHGEDGAAAEDHPPGSEKGSNGKKAEGH